MLRDSAEFNRFEIELIKEKSNIDNNFRIVDAMYDEAVELGIFPIKDPLEGIDTDIKVERAVNSV